MTWFRSSKQLARQNQGVGQGTLANMIVGIKDEWRVGL